jgi:hypothetical protein
MYGGIIMPNGKRVEFNEEGVIFHFPDEIKDKNFPEYTYHARRLSIAAKLPPLDKYRIFRPLVEVEVFIRNGSQCSAPQKFDPAIRIQVYYQDSDIEAVGGNYRELVLYYYHGNQWKPFTPEKHDFVLIPIPSDHWKGYGVAKIEDWVDPVIAWGQ